MENKNIDIEKLIEEWYVPSSTERKKALIMYFFVWIMVWLINKWISKFEWFHLKQSLWWWMVFFLCFAVSLFLFFIPFLWILSTILFLFIISIWIYFVNMAYNWKYTTWDTSKIMFPFFYWIWWWILDIFEIDWLYKENEINTISWDEIKSDKFKNNDTDN